MALAPSRVANGLIWATIGANAYVWARWHIVPGGEAAKQGPGPQARDMVALSRHRRYMDDNYTISLRNIREGRWWTLVTSALSHYDIVHLGINMLVLRTTASLAVSGAIGLGPTKLAALALGSAVCGSLGSLYDYQQSAAAAAAAAAGQPEPRGLGASGMVQGLMVATMFAQPRWPMMIFPIPVEVPYWTAVAAFLGYDMYRLYEEKKSGQKHVNWRGSYTGYAAHLGGAVFGTAFYFLAMRRGMMVRRARWAQPPRRRP